jgi:Ca-activated chloride channel family protein
MDQMAALSGGNAMLVSTPSDLDHFMMQKLSELETIYARGLRFEFETSPELKLRYAFRLSPNIGPLETASPILLGDIQHRRSVSFLLEFMVPPNFQEDDRLTLARGRIWMDIPGQKTPRTRVFLDLNRPVRSNPDVEAPPAAIIEAMAKLTLYRLQEKVRLEVGEGQIDNATKHMHYLATHLLSQGDRELAHTVLIEAEHIQQSRRLSGEGEKRIKYGTRALMLPSGPEFKP